MILPRASGHCPSTRFDPGGGVYRVYLPFCSLLKVLLSPAPAESTSHFTAAWQTSHFIAAWQTNQFKVPTHACLIQTGMSDTLNWWLPRLAARSNKQMCAALPAAPLGARVASAPWADKADPCALPRVPVSPRVPRAIAQSTLLNPGGAALADTGYINFWSIKAKGRRGVVFDIVGLRSMCCKP